METTFQRQRFDVSPFALHQHVDAHEARRAKRSSPPCLFPIASIGVKRALPWQHIIISMLPTTGWLGFPVVVGHSLEQAIYRQEVRLIFLNNHHRNVCSSDMHGAIDNVPVPSITKTKHIGLCMTTLGWSAHIEDTLHWVSYRVYPLKRFAYRTGSSTLIATMCKGVLRLVVEYVGAVWDSSFQHDALTLERMQLSVSRSILWANWQAVSKVGKQKLF